jgi:hypothetical protein
MDSNGIIHVAITGHRFINSNEMLIQSIKQVFHTILSDYKGFQFFLISALAEGSDQLVAKIALENPVFKLIVPLPMAVEDYMLDFHSNLEKDSFHQLMQAASKIITLTKQPDHHSAYRHLENYIVSNCDILIALWNGEFSGRPGGTGEVVKSAINAGKPVFWIYCNNDKYKAVNIFKNQKVSGDIEILAGKSLPPQLSNI